VAKAAVPDMRDWGLVAPSELERLVIVSPHLDDAVLGCSYLLAAHPGATVVTVFAGRPAEYPQPMQHWDTLCGFVEGDEVHEARRAEDRAALALFDARPVWLDFVEHSYLERPEWVRPAAIVDDLEATLVRLRPTAVFAPFGLGNPDHDSTHDACMLVRDRMSSSPDREPTPSWFCYEDTGYKHIPGLLAWRVAKLFRAGVWPTPAAVPIDADHDRKLAAYACYPSQVRALEAEWQLGAKLEAPAPEQYWRLAPPPDGWGALPEQV
jgi:LmbE family N-acetylglucosaminyl deacetylase